MDDSYGRTALGGAIKEMKALGKELVAKIPVQKQNVSMKTFAIKLKESNADSVQIFLTPFQGLNLIKCSKDFNFNPLWMAGTPFSDFEYLYKIAGNIIEGMISTTIVQLDDNILSKKYDDLYKKLNTKYGNGHLYYKYGIHFAEILVEGLRMCKDQLSKEHFIQEMENMKNFIGIAGQPINYKPFNPSDPNCREGLKKIYLIQCLDQGKIKILTEWIEPGQRIKLKK
jgi:branched-chain amino acid transport system substrate-binding protein